MNTETKRPTLHLPESTRSIKADIESMSIALGLMKAQIVALQKDVATLNSAVDDIMRYIGKHKS